MEKLQQLFKIEQEITCTHCDFKSKIGSEMYDHLWHKHSMFFHDMQYVMSGRIGRGNTYRWLITSATDLGVDSLQKCNHCRKPYIAYNGGDDCEDCRKLPEVSAYLKYSYNRAEIESENHYTHICKKCGEKSSSSHELRSHGVLSTIDGITQYRC